MAKVLIAGMHAHTSPSFHKSVSQLLEAKGIEALDCDWKLTPDEKTTLDINYDQVEIHRCLAHILASRFLDQVLECQALMIVIEGREIDGYTAMLVAYAYQEGKTIFAYWPDWQPLIVSATGLADYLIMQSGGRIFTALSEIETNIDLISEAAAKKMTVPPFTWNPHGKAEMVE